VTKTWAGLVNVEVTSGTAQGGPIEAPTFRGFVTIRAIAEDGSFMTGQLDPAELRVMAMRFLSVAEAADQDAMLLGVLSTVYGMDTAIAAQVILALRAKRPPEVQWP
jgi:hypothetical protein